MKPTTVVVHESNSPMFPFKDQTYSFSEFEALALSSITLFPGDEDTDDLNCTDVTITFSNGDRIEAHLDLIEEGGMFGVQDFLSMAYVQLVAQKGNPSSIAFMERLDLVTH